MSLDLPMLQTDFQVSLINLLLFDVHIFRFDFSDARYLLCLRVSTHYIIIFLLFAAFEIGRMNQCMRASCGS